MPPQRLQCDFLTAEAVHHLVDDAHAPGSDATADGIAIGPGKVVERGVEQQRGRQGNALRRQAPFVEDCRRCSSNDQTRSPNVMPEVPYPVRVPDLGDVIAISAGSTHSMALRRDGTVLAWGSNRFGQVGDGTTVNRDRPVVVPGVRNAVSIAAGAHFSVVVLSDGTAMEWGATYTNPAPRRVPAPLPGVRGAKSVVAGDGHAAALTETGSMITWGTTRTTRPAAAGTPRSALVPSKSSPT